MTNLVSPERSGNDSSGKAMQGESCLKPERCNTGEGLVSGPDNFLLQVLDGWVGVGELSEQPLTGLSLWALRPLFDVDLSCLQIRLPSQQH